MEGRGGEMGEGRQVDFLQRVIGGRDGRETTGVELLLDEGADFAEAHPDDVGGEEGEEGGDEEDGGGDAMVGLLVAGVLGRVLDAQGVLGVEPGVAQHDADIHERKLLRQRHHTRHREHPHPNPNRRLHRRTHMSRHRRRPH